MDTNVIKTAVTDALSCDEKNKYYVYALCEKTSDNKLVPFYIGKGEGSRVWAHEDGFEKEKEYINEFYSDELQEDAIQNLSEKYKKIDEIKQNVEKIIIKWGLTSEEAFMAESALINLLKMEQLSFDRSKDSLTNIANGHTSVGEKNSLTETKARTIEQFYNDCAKEPIDFDTELGQRNIVLISINRGYPECCALPADKQNDAIREMARGFWKLSDKRIPDYLFAMYRQRVVGIYKINPSKKDIKLKRKTKKVNVLYTILDVARDDYPQYKGLRIRDTDFELATRIRRESENKGVDLITDFSDFSQDLQSELKEYWGTSTKCQKYYENWRQRKYYVLEDIDQSDEMANYLGKRIIENKNDINGVTYTTSPIPPRNYIRYTKRV